MCIVVLILGLLSEPALSMMLAPCLFASVKGGTSEKGGGKHRPDSFAFATGKRDHEGAMATVKQRSVGAGAVARPRPRPTSNSAGVQHMAFFNIFIPSDRSHAAHDIVNEQMEQLRETTVDKIRYMLIAENGNETGPTCRKCERISHLRHATEIDALNALHSWCCSDEASDDTLVTYLHNKGSNNGRRGSNALNRRMQMRSLAACDAAGSPFRQGRCSICSARFSPLPHFHAPGNMWTTRCGYVRRLAKPSVLSQELDEMYVGSTKPTWCGPTGRYVAEHWSHSHPAVVPCDAYPNPRFMWGYNGLPANDLWTPAVSVAPRWEVALYRRHLLAVETSCRSFLHGFNNSFAALLKRRIGAEWAATYPQAKTAAWVAPFLRG